MADLQNIQRISKLLRYLVIGVASAIFAAAVIGRVFYGQWWVDVGDANFQQLWQSQTVSHLLMTAIIAPVLVIAILAVYWLQRLFGEFQRGEFFSDASMRCFLWLVWLKVAAFSYAIVWPLILNTQPDANSGGEIEVVINISNFFTLLLLVVVVHLLKEAQAIQRENREFI